MPTSATGSDLRARSSAKSRLVSSSSRAIHLRVSTTLSPPVGPLWPLLLVTANIS